MAFINHPSPTPILASLAGKGWAIKKTPTWASVVHTSVSGKERRIARQAFPLWEFEVPFNFLREQTPNQTPYAQYSGFTDAQQVMAFFGALQGQYGEFYFDDVDDDSRPAAILGTAGTLAAPTQALLPTTDGVSTVYVPLRQWGGVNTGQPAGIDLTDYDPVGGINTVNSVSGTAISYTVGGNDGRSIVFNSAPAAGLSLTASLSYYYRCRFITDTQEWQEFMANLHKGTVKFRSVKP